MESLRITVFGKSEPKAESSRPWIALVDEPWYLDLQKLANEELMRMYAMLADVRYRFAKNAWYIPLGTDQRCPMMVAKGFRSPDTLDRMAEFQETAKTLEAEYRNFIDAWDFGYISRHDIEKAILKILESRNIAVSEQTSSV